MSTHELLPIVVQAFVPAVVLPLIAYFMLRRRSGKALAFENRNVLRHTGAMKSVVLLSWIGWTFILGAAFFLPKSTPDDRKIATAILVVTGLGLLYLHIEIFGTTVFYDETGIESRTVLRGVRAVTWEEVESVYFLAGTYVCKTKRCGGVHVSNYFIGITTFLETLKARAINARAGRWTDGTD